MSEDAQEEPMKLLTCSICGNKYGVYLHFCPKCRTPNSSQEYKDYWGKRHAD